MRVPLGRAGELAVAHGWALDDGGRVVPKVVGILETISGVLAGLAAAQDWPGASKRYEQSLLPTIARGGSGHPCYAAFPVTLLLSRHAELLRHLCWQQATLESQQARRVERAGGDASVLGIRNDGGHDVTRGAGDDGGCGRAIRCRCRLAASSAEGFPAGTRERGVVIDLLHVDQYFDLQSHIGKRNSTVVDHTGTEHLVKVKQSDDKKIGSMVSNSGLFF